MSYPVVHISSPLSVLSVEPIPRAPTLRAALAILVLFLMLLPPVLDGNARASDTDIFEALFQQMTYKMYVSSQHAAKGFTLIAPYGGYKVYLVDYEKTTIHTWSSNHQTLGTCELLENGTLLRGRSGAAGQASGIEMLAWDGSVIWEYETPQGYAWHHDIEPLPSGNLLINVMVSYQSDEIIAMGRDPSTTMANMFVDPVLEIKLNGTTGGDIVWMWDPLDHIIQDYDSGLPNHGVVKDHPELIDINYPPEIEPDWQHANAVSYNAELDQVMITNRNLDEIWVIDHSTTTEEAVGHSGGARGKGGDLLYRWGNPQAYDSGVASDHVLYGPHDGHWVAPGLPGEGNIIVFNNGMNAFGSRPEGKFSSVEELAPPLNATGCYDRASGSAYGPSETLWHYTTNPPEDFWGNAMGGVERLPNGNTLVCGGSSSYNFEVDEDNKIVWEYEAYSLFRMSRSYPPVLDKAFALNATEDVLQRVDISPFISDADTDHEGLMLEVDSLYISVSGHELTLQYPEGVRTDVVNLSVSDGLFMVGRNIRVNITPVNDPPRLRQIPDVAAIEDVPYVLGLMSYVMDPETNINQLNITVDSPYVTVERAKLTFLYPDGVLTDTVHLSVSDGELADSGEILVNVTPVNDAPAVDLIPDQVGVEDVPWALDLGMYIRDIDTPIENISVATDSRHTIVTGLSLGLLYPDGVTRDSVFLTVSDGEMDTVVGFNVTIEPVNDPPVLGDVPPLSVREDEPFSLDLGPSISDIDTPRDELTIMVGSLFVVVEGHTLSLLYPEGVLRDELVIVLWDGPLYAITTLVVEVAPVNDPPWWGAVPDIAAVEDVEGQLDLAPYFNDIDTPFGQLAVSVASSYGSVDGRTLIFFYPDGVLNEVVTLTLTDGESQSVLRLNVTVSPVNDAPELLGARVDAPGHIALTMFNFTVVFKDVDMGPDAPVVEVVIDGVNYRMGRDELGTGPYGEGVPFLLGMALGAGNHTFYFTADDGDGGVATTGTYSVVVDAIPQETDPSTPTGSSGSSPPVDVIVIVIVVIIIVGAAALVAAAGLLMARRGSSRPPA